MPKITLDLNQFKANGVYTVEFDASESFTISSQQLRLIVGFSRKGPFNAPVFLQNVKNARKIFGEIDTFLEKKGSYFHRAIETALQTGPVFALNLMPLNNTPNGDKIDYRSFSLSMDEYNGDVSKDLMASFYNKERFWFPDTSYFDAIVNNNPLNENMLMSFTNLGQKPLSFIVRKAVGLKGFDITARDFYGVGNIPDFVGEFDYISDYFIDVMVVEGDWTDYENLSIDPEYSTYFDKTGVKVSKLNDFLASDNVTLIANYTGCIIPDFVDKEGVNQFIETIINNSQSLTGVFMTINRDALDNYETSEYKVDLIGNSLINSTNDKINMLSYVSPITDQLGYSSDQEFSDQDMTFSFDPHDFSNVGNVYPYIKSIPYTGNENRGMFFNTLVIPKPRAAFSGQVFTQTDYNNLLRDLTDITLFKTYGHETAWQYAKVETITNTGTSIEITYSNPGDDAYAAKGNVGLIDNINIVNVNETDNSIFTTNVNALGLKQFDLVYIKGTGKYYVIEEVIDSSPQIEIKFYTGNTEVVAELPPAWLNYAKTIPEHTKVTTDMIGNVAAGCEVDMQKEVVINIDTTNTITYIEKPDYMYMDSALTSPAEECIFVLPGNALYTEVKNNTVVNGDYISGTPVFNNPNYLSFSDAKTMYGLTGLQIRQWKTADLTTLATNICGIDSDCTYTKDGQIADPTYFGDGRHGFVLFSAHGKIEENVKIIEDTLNAGKTIFRIPAEETNKIQVGQYIVNNDTNNPKLTRVVKKIKKVNPETNEVEYRIELNEAVKITEVDGKFYVTRYLDINDPGFTTNLQFTKLDGFTITTYHVPGTPSQLEKILGVIENTNLGEVLADREMISFRYLVDTFGGGLAPMMGPKAILSRLAKNRQKCMAILNAPSIADFVASTDPRFTEEPDPAAGIPNPLLNTEYIATGGNLSLGPSYTFSLPDDENGARFTGVFTPFLTIREANKNKNIPPAADVSNNFIRKFRNGTPYAIAAGPRRGIISNPLLVGLEYEFLKSDRANLEPFGLNCIITTRNTGPMIYGNATAYQKTLTAFNNLHVRDLLITIEETVEDILANYIFEFNDAQTRLEIKTIVEGYLQNVKNAGGIYEFMVVMDESNNTTEIIDQNIGIIDIGIEPARGMQKIINRVTVLKTGAIASGGFTIA